MQRRSRGQPGSTDWQLVATFQQTSTVRGLSDLDASRHSAKHSPVAFSRNRFDDLHADKTGGQMRRLSWVAIFLLAASWSLPASGQAHSGSKVDIAYVEPD